MSPKVQKKSGFADRLSKSLTTHAKDETNMGMDFTNLPPGITGGVAKLVEAKLGIYAKGANQGEKFVFLQGSVQLPIEHTFVARTFQEGKVVNLPPQTLKVQGLFTKQTLPLCDTKNAAGETTELDEHVETMLNELRKLGGESFTEDVGDEPSLEAALETLKEAAPYFKFSTSSSTPTAAYPNERTWENWRGAVDFVPDEDAGGVVEEVGDGGSPETETEESGDSGGDDGGLVALATAADNGDEEAKKELEKQAMAAGVSQKDYAAADTYAEVLPLMASAMDSGDNSDKEEAEPAAKEWAPEVGEVYNFRPPGTRKQIECEVTASYGKNKTVNLVNLDDKTKTYKGIPWASLIQ